MKMGASKLDNVEKEKMKSCVDDDLGPPVPPDGGWGWVIVIASVICNIIVDGICFSFSIQFMEYQTYFNSTSAQTALVGSLLAGCYLLIGPLASALANCFGCRKVTIAGSVISSLAFILSTFTTDITMLTITYGIMGGIGFGLIYLPAIVIVGFYFEQRRAFATGIAVCGSGIGMLLFGPFTRYLLQEYDWRGANLILAGVILQCAICGALFRPLEVQTQAQKEKRFRKERDIPFDKIRRGSIFTKIMEEKQRQRTISQGSLDGCLITRDNMLVKLPPHLVRSSSNCMAIRVSPDGAPSPLIGVSTSKSPPKTALSELGPDGPRNPDVDRVDRLSLQLQSRRGTDPGIATPTSSIKLGGSLPASQSSGLNLSEQVANSSAYIDADQKKQDLARPMYRKDIFFSGSMAHVPQYVSSPDVQSYVYSITSVPSYYYEDELCCSNYYPTAKSMWDVLKQMLDLQLLMNPVFIILSISSILTMLGFFVPLQFIVSFAVQNGCTPRSLNLFFMLLGIMNVVGRVMTGFICDQPWASSLYINNCALIVAGALTAALPTFTTLPLVLAYGAGFGLCMAAFASLRSIIVVELLGLDHLTNAFGLLILFQGVASLIGAPIAGMIVDANQGDFTISFCLAGGLIMLSGLMCFPLRCLARCLQKQEKGKTGDQYQPVPSPV